MLTTHKFDHGELTDPLTKNAYDLKQNIPYILPCCGETCSIQTIIDMKQKADGKCALCRNTMPDSGQIKNNVLCAYLENNETGPKTEQKVHNLRGLIWKFGAVLLVISIFLTYTFYNRNDQSMTEVPDTSLESQDSNSINNQKQDIWSNDLNPLFIDDKDASYASFVDPQPEKESNSVKQKTTQDPFIKDYNQPAQETSGAEYKSNQVEGFQSDPFDDADNMEKIVYEGESDLHDPHSYIGEVSDMNDEQISIALGFLNGYVTSLDETQLLQKLVLANMNDEKAKLLPNLDLSRLTNLELVDSQLGPEGIKALARCNLHSLKYLSLIKIGITDQGAGYLAKGSFSNLKILLLHSNSISDEGAKAISHGNFPSLETLSLRKNQVGVAGATSLAHSSLKNLNSLDLSSNVFDDQGAVALSRGDFPRLSTLFLRGNKLTDEGAFALLQGKFPKLKVLDLSENEIKLEKSSDLTQGVISKLSTLRLVSNKIGNKGLQFLLSRKFTSLKILDLSFNSFSKVSISPVNFPVIQELQLKGSKVDSFDVSSSTAKFRKLKTLNLSYNKIDNVQAKKIKDTLSYVQTLILKQN